jgi:hypothetical protein
MQKKPISLLAFAFTAQVALFGGIVPADTQTPTAPYATMAPLDQYMIPDQTAEIALARSGAPKSISDAAEVLVLGRDGYTSAVKGTNGFVCLVQRGWAAATDFSEFWSPKVHAPICFNAASARTYLPIILMKTKLVVAGKSKAEIAQAVKSGLDSKQLPPLEPGAMCYMMSKQQYLNDQAKNWHPHMMWFVPGSAAASWGANLPGSPAIAANDPEERLTIMLVWVGHWSDGTPAPPDLQPTPPPHKMN